MSRLRVGGVGERPASGRVGRLTGVRPAHPAGVAQVPMVLPGAGMPGRVVHRDRRPDRIGPTHDDRSCWVTEQVGRNGRTVNEIADELGCDWHTINDTVIAYGTPLIDDPARIGNVEALGLDETGCWL